MDKVIFLDRDGVINVDLIGDYIKTTEEFRFEKGSIEALQLLGSAGFKIIIISNQAGVGDGLFTEADCWKVHYYMIDLLRKEGIPIFDTQYCFCPKEEPPCPCRKPNTGMFEEAVKKVHIDKLQTFFIGDKATDVEAGKRFGLKTCFVRTGHGKNDEKKLTENLEPDLRADNLLEAVRLLLKQFHNS